MTSHHDVTSSTAPSSFPTTIVVFVVIHGALQSKSIQVQRPCGRCPAAESHHSRQLRRQVRLRHLARTSRQLTCLPALQAALQVGAVFTYTVDILRWREAAFASVWITLVAANVGFIISTIFQRDRYPHLSHQTPMPDPLQLPVVTLRKLGTQWIHSVVDWPLGHAAVQVDARAASPTRPANRTAPLGLCSAHCYGHPQLGTVRGSRNGTRSISSHDYRMLHLCPVYAATANVFSKTGTQYAAL